MKSQKVRQITTRAPDIETLRKREEEKKFAVWESYLLKQRDIVKNQKKVEKEATAIAEDRAEKKQEKNLKIQTNIKNVASDQSEMARTMNKKWKQMEKKVQNSEQQKKILCLKHREIENLKFEDLNENLELLKSEKFSKNCKIGEKHLALTAMNCDKK